MAFGGYSLTEEEKKAMTLNKFQEQALIVEVCKEFNITEDKFKELAEYPSMLWTYLYASYFPFKERLECIKEHLALLEKNKHL